MFWSGVPLEMESSMKSPKSKKWVPSHIPIPKYSKGNFMLQKFQEFKKKYLTLPWITLGLCVVILVVNLIKG
jgi:hypothetical protein